MTVETHLHRARDRIACERTAVEAKRDALSAFATRVRDRSPGGARTEMSGQVGGGGVAARAVPQGTDDIEQVRTAFAETVGEQTAAESVLASLQQELGEETALALAPTTNAAFTPQLQQQLLSRTQTRRRELAATLTALDGEGESVRSQVESVESVVSWLTSADETPLSELGFDRLRARHERLAAFREACATAIEDRQAWLDGTTSHAGQVGVRHRTLVTSLYEDFPVEYPALATVTRLVEVCEDAQRAVRDHLVRRA